MAVSAFSGDSLCPCLPRGGNLGLTSFWLGAVADLWTTRSPLGISAGVWGLALNYAVCVAASRSRSAEQARETPASASPQRIGAERG